MKILDKIIISPTPPSSKNVAWFDGKSIKIYSKGKWENASESSSGGGGGGIQIVDSEEKLNILNVPVGSLAAVAVPGTIKESSFRDLYQPDASILDTNTNTITNPEILSRVTSIKVTAPEGNIEGVASGVAIVPSDFSPQSNAKMIAIYVEASDNIVTKVSAMVAVNSYKQLPLITYNDGVLTVDNSAIETINNYLASGDDWCYLSSPEGNFAITEEQFATLDKFIHSVSGIPSTAEIYIKKDNWEKLNKEDFELLTNEINNLKSTKQDVILNKQVSGTTITIFPNVYNKLYAEVAMSIQLGDVEDENRYNEYIIEIICNVENAKISIAKGSYFVKWANDTPPVFTKNMIYVISIVNNLAVYSMFPNS